MLKIDTETFELYAFSFRQIFETHVIDEALNQLNYLEILSQLNTLKIIFNKLMPPFI